MNNRDIFEQKTIIFKLDKLYNIRFTMRAVYVLEDIYGSIGIALKKLYSRDTDVTVVTVIDFLYALLAVDKACIEEHLNIEKLLEAMEKISEAVGQHFPSNTISGEERSASESWDWDWLYYLARYRLKMSDSEFWECTPRKFYKLNYLWRVDNGLEKAEPRKVFIDEIAF